jgi:hypothetical protein
VTVATCARFAFGRRPGGGGRDVLAIPMVLRSDARRRRRALRRPPPNGQHSSGLAMRYPRADGSFAAGFMDRMSGACDLDHVLFWPAAWDERAVFSPHPRARSPGVSPCAGCPINPGPAIGASDCWGG